MVINFDIERLDRLLYDFYRITGITVSIWDAQINQLSFQPKQMRSFCKVVHATARGDRLCYLSDRALCEECAKTGGTVSAYCHAGLIDTVVPIKFHDKILGYIMFGQIADKPSGEVEPMLRELSKNIGVDYEYLHSLYDELEIHDAEKIGSLANVLKQATRYLWLSDHIKIGYDTTAAKIDAYIRTNLKEDLSVETLCRAFTVSKNKLYAIAHTHFGMTIGEYIAQLRISEAKQLLQTTDLPVTQISDMVGIRNYNYFTKFFRKHTGISPLAYRKTGLQE